MVLLWDAPPLLWMTVGFWFDRDEDEDVYVVAGSERLLALAWGHERAVPSEHEYALFSDERSLVELEVERLEG